MKSFALATAALAAFFGSVSSAAAQEVLQLEFVMSYPGYPNGARTTDDCLEVNHQTYLSQGAVEASRTRNGRWYTADDDYGKGKFLMYCSDNPGVVGIGVRFASGATRYPNLNFNPRAHHGQADCLRRANAVVDGNMIYSRFDTRDDSVTAFNRTSNIAVTIVCTDFGEVLFIGWGRGELIGERNTVEQLWAAQ
ncbi:hypothetical protein [Sphingosinithalassobacter portus]|uniref:hypothetical protein n=1 Tax=Stakelama portus TaxID=2676234 RepID=UPI0011AB3DAE|nr:hypothetical protein [Sphingosinithalassobacter portus]